MRQGLRVHAGRVRSTPIWSAGRTPAGSEAFGNGVAPRRAGASPTLVSGPQRSAWVPFLSASELRQLRLRPDMLLCGGLGIGHGIAQDTCAGRQESERHLERRRLEELDEAALAEFRRAWSFGGEALRQQCDEKMKEKGRGKPPSQDPAGNSRSQGRPDRGGGAGAPALDGGRPSRRSEERSDEAGSGGPFASGDDAFGKTDRRASATRKAQGRASRSAPPESHPWPRCSSGVASNSSSCPQVTSSWPLTRVSWSKTVIGAGPNGISPATPSTSSSRSSAWRRLLLGLNELLEALRHLITHLVIWYALKRRRIGDP